MSAAAVEGFGHKCLTLLPRNPPKRRQPSATPPWEKQCVYPVTHGCAVGVAKVGGHLTFSSVGTNQMNSQRPRQWNSAQQQK